jgi:hypothetical protein
MKQQKSSQAAARSAKETRRKLAQEHLFETIRAVRKANEGVDPDQVLADVTEAVEAVRRRS